MEEETFIKSTLFAFVRNGLSAACGVLVTKGIIAKDDAELIIGAGCGAVALAWIVWRRWKQTRPKVNVVAPIVTSMLAVACLVVGCATAGTTFGRLLVSTDMTVDKAMTGWFIYVRDAKPPLEQELKVKAAYEKYQASMEEARSSYSVWIINKNQTELVQARALVQSASSNVLALIKTFKVN